MAAPEPQPAASTSSELSRPFDLVLFDWDGTAVPDRYADASALAAALTQALERGILFVLVTGTNFENIDRQLIQMLPRDARRNLFVCTNRGSEVRSFDASGAPVIRYRREASAEENLALDRAARALQDYLRGFGLKTEIVWNRMNRRKVDLIPTEKWRDPKKAQFAELARDVESRLKSAGLLGGLSKVLQESVRLAREAGMTSPRITSDLKHVEIGLTDKSDSAAWARDELMRARGIPAERIAILGDEFGGVGSLRGSDSLMRVPGLERAAVISVGAEPNGVPDGVVHLPGGPPRFAELLRLQIRERDEPTRDPSWLLE